MHCMIKVAFQKHIFKITKIIVRTIEELRAVDGASQTAPCLVCRQISSSEQNPYSQTS